MDNTNTTQKVFTRYDYMFEGSSFDPKDDILYPDPLSFNFNSFTFTTPPIRYELTEAFIQKPYLFTNALYNNTSFDDVILTLNNIPHVSELDKLLSSNEEITKIIVFPASQEEIKQFLNTSYGELV